MIKTMKSKKNKGAKVVDRKFMELCSGRLTLTDTTYEEYRNRACRVATHLRKAAKLLPE